MTTLLTESVDKEEARETGEVPKPEGSLALSSNAIQMHLSSAFPRGDPRLMWENISYGDFMGNKFLPLWRGKCGTLIFECFTLGKNVGTSLLFNQGEIRKDRLFA